MYRMATGWKFRKPYEYRVDFETKNGYQLEVSKPQGYQLENPKNLLEGLIL